MPFDEETCNNKSPGRGCEGPFGSFYYNPDRSSAPGIDQFINAEAGCTFMEVLKYWNKNNCPEDDGCQVQFGDMYHKTTWGDHSSHHSGNCIDVVSMRKNQLELTVSHVTIQRCTIERKLKILLTYLIELGLL